MFRPRGAAGRFVFLHIPGVCFRRTRVQIRLDTDERKRHVPFPLAPYFSLHLTVRTGAASRWKLSRTLDARYCEDPCRCGAALVNHLWATWSSRIRLFLVIQFTQRKPIINREFILFRTRDGWCFFAHRRGKKRFIYIHKSKKLRQRNLSDKFNNLARQKIDTRIPHEYFRNIVHITFYTQV